MIDRRPERGFWGAGGVLLPDLAGGNIDVCFVLNHCLKSFIFVPVSVCMCVIIQLKFF